MSTNDKLIIAFLFVGMIITFIGILAIIMEKYKKAETEKKADELADAEEINQKILQMHDYGEFLSKELSDKQNEAMLMYEMLLEQEKKLSANLPAEKEAPATKRENLVPPVNRNLREEKNPFDFMATPAENHQPPGSTALHREKRQKRQHPTEESISGNHNAEIRELYSRGLSEAEIAKQIGIGKGQVELVIRLFEKGLEKRSEKE